MTTADRGVLLSGSLLGLGFVPGPTGTYASVATAAAMAGLYRLGCPWWSVASSVAVLAALGVAAGGVAERVLGRSDPGSFVLDEVVGMGIAGLAAWWVRPVWLSGRPWGWAVLAMALVWFRAADIFKPPPIRLAERLPGGWGMVADDVLAGLLALGLTVLAVWVLNHWFR